MQWRSASWTCHIFIPLTDFQLQLCHACQFQFDNAPVAIACWGSNLSTWDEGNVQLICLSHLHEGAFVKLHILIIRDSNWDMSSVQLVICRSARSCSLKRFIPPVYLLLLSSLQVMLYDSNLWIVSISVEFLWTYRIGSPISIWKNQSSCIAKLSSA